MRVSSLVGAAEPPPILPHTHARARTLAPMLVGADVLGGPLHPPVLPLTSPLASLSPPSHLPLASKNIKKERESLSVNPLVRIYSNG